jgi:hypothetical protein
MIELVANPADENGNGKVAAVSSDVGQAFSPDCRHLWKEFG